MNSATRHLLRPRIDLVRSARETRTNNPSTINNVSRFRSIGLPDRSGSITVPPCPAKLSHVERLRVLTMNSQTYGIQIQSEGVVGLWTVAGVSTGEAASKEAGVDWIKRDARHEEAG